MANPFDRFDITGNRNPFDQFDQQSQSGASPLVDAGSQLVRQANKGIADLVTAPYRALDWGIEAATGGRYGLPDVGNMPAWQTYRDQPEAETNLGRYAGAGGYALGSSALPVAGAVNYAQQAARLPATVAQQTQTVPNLIRRGVENIAARPGAAVAAEAVGATGAGVGQQAAEDAGMGPLGQTVGAIAGSVAPFALYRPLQSAVGWGVQAARDNLGERGAYNKVAESLPDGVDRLTSQVATGSGTNQANIQTRTLEILGEEMVRSRGNVAAARASTIQRIVDETGLAPSTAQDQIRRVEDLHRENLLTLGEYPSISEANEATRNVRNVTDETLARAGEIRNTGTQGTLDYLANASNMRSAQTVRNTIETRYYNLREGMRRTLQRFSPNNQTIDDANQMLEDIGRQASAEYRRVHRDQSNINYSLLHRRLGQVLNGHLRRMSGRSGEQAEAMRAALNEFYLTYPDGTRAPTPTLQQMQDMRASVRGMITRAVQSGDTHIVQALQPLYNNVTRVMSLASPSWARVNRRWADLQLNELAQEIGESISERAGPRFREQMQQFNSMAPEAQNYVQIEVVQKLLDKIENAGSTHDLAKLFDKPHFTRLVRTIFGDQDAMTFRRAIAQQRVATGTKNLTLNSRTHIRGEVKEANEADINIAAAASQANAQGVRMWLLKKATDILAEQRRGPMADILTTPMHNVPQVAQRLELMRRARQQATRPRPERAARPVSQFATPLLTQENYSQNRNRR